MVEKTASFFVTGTDTEVGKTFVSAALVHALTQRDLRCIGMKPIASGSEKTDKGLRNSDAMILRSVSNVNVPYSQINPYIFEPPISPHFAAKDAGQKISITEICHQADALKKQTDRLIIEGVGGWRVPLNDQEDVSDLAKQLNTSVILVIGLRLGCINHALLTAAAIRASGLSLIACVASQVDRDYQKCSETLVTLSERLLTPVDFLPFQAQQDPTQVGQYLQQTIETLL